MKSVAEQTESHSELFGLIGQKRASTTAGAGAGSGVIGTSGHTGIANKAAETLGSQPAANSERAGIAQGGKSNRIIGSGSEQFTPSQGAGNIAEQRGEKQSLVDKLNPLK